MLALPNFWTSTVLVDWLSQAANAALHNRGVLYRNARKGIYMNPIKKEQRATACMSPKIITDFLGL
jgi:hypothetical protein